MRARLLGIMTLIGCMLLHGCAVFSPSYTKPEVSLANVEMLKSNLWEQSFRLKLRVDNPNDRVLPIRGMHYQVYLNNMKLATGVSNNRFDVPAYGSSYFELDVRSNLWRHIADVIKLVDKQKPVDYRIDGNIRTGMLLAPSINLHEEGTLDPSQLSF
ncbi:LEA type 2 family protein [Halopseudomonas sp.]|mgnify:FL=1|uniref:LEA type 2 family protein n=1 Tax=Halopseudomonas sp. TaxID=2901191 RepID=UPI00300162C3|nr:LEA type 2 family protein [Halopseudomonas aestusnigri]